MAEKKIKLIINRLGNVDIDAQGFQGHGCKEATKALEEALARGTEGVEVVTKPSWNETEDESVVHETHTKGGW